MVPLVLLNSGFVGMVLVTSSMMADTQGNEPPTWFFAVVANNMLYILSLILLVIQLVQGGTKGNNRFGPDPLLR